jgi:hypothetical protein
VHTLREPAIEGYQEARERERVLPGCRPNATASIGVAPHWKTMRQSLDQHALWVVRWPPRHSVLQLGSMSFCQPGTYASHDGMIVVTHVTPDL